MSDNLHVSVSPHIHSGRSTRSIMLEVIIALLPAMIAGTVIFGLRSIAVICVCVAVCVFSEFFFNAIVKKPRSVQDLSAVVTGVLLALNLPANIPLWQAAIGSVFAIVVVKCFFGGIGQNFANPAITARVFMIVAFGSMAKAAFPVVDGVSGATPLEIIASDGEISLLDLFLGTHGGAIGETCTLALLVGGIYLIARGIISWHCPVGFIGTVFVLSFLIEGDVVNALALSMSGGLFIGAFFMATDYSTSPINSWGRLIFGIGCGLITVLIRFWGAYPEGVSFAILLMNILTPYIDKWTAHKVFGGKKG